MARSFDCIIIGAGQAGPSLAARLSRAGRSVALIERKLLGGTCVNTGCTPTKTMVASAAVAEHVRRASQYGVHLAGEFHIALADVSLRAEEVVNQSRAGLRGMLEKLENCTLVQGPARFTSAHEVDVQGERFRGERIFLNVGGRPRIPDFPGVESIPFLTSSSILRLKELPPHLVIVGGGYIGIEFAQMFRRFGSAVTLVEMGPRLAAHEDDDVSTAILDLLKSEGVTVRLNAECIAFEKRDAELLTHVNCDGGEPVIAGSHVLLAVGRQPNTDDLGLSAAGVDTDTHGFIRVTDELLTSVPHIWAMGDCNGRGAFTHTAYNDYEIVAANLLDGESRRVTDRIPAYALYTDPPMAHVGLTENEARRSGRKLLTAVRPMSRVSRAIEKGETFGFMKAIVDAETQRILGATIFGVGGDEAIHAVLDTMYADAPYTVLARAVHIHPTVAELLPTLLQSLQPLT